LSALPKTVSAKNAPSRAGGHIVLLMLLMVVIPAAITLHTVRVPVAAPDISSNPTPYGYTWSLLLFIVPIAVIAGWFLPHDGVEIPRKAFWRTIALLVPSGAGLDFFFAHWFFRFPNAGATLGIAAPALGKPVPIEEYAFYLTGFIAVLLIYVWANEYWFAAYNPANYTGESRKIPRLLQFHAGSLTLGLALIVAGIVYKKFFSPVPAGFPGYFTFLVATAVVPAAAFLPSVRPFINWRAFSLTMFIVVLISLVWEATLGIPYGWWGFQENQMLGLSIGAWYGLPIEEVGLWIAVSYATVIVFEVMKLWQASGKKARHAFLGIGPTMTSQE
jgi:lycopene cyclase domain-containing protein